jgi:L-histidine Nalpha-methyltransferase
VSLTSALAAPQESSRELETRNAVAEAAHTGLTSAPKALPPWLFYDEAGSILFEEITRLPEYYLTRTERALFAQRADEIFDLCGGSGISGHHQNLRVVELGAGTATKTGILLKALAERQPEVHYQPIDISPSALDEAATTLTDIRGLRIAPCVANYITDSVALERRPGDRVLALYIGSSIGNFSPEEGRSILRNLRENLQSGDVLLLGTDLAPSETKSVDVLLAAYNDAAGVTAAFNRNILRHLNRELRTNFQVDRFRHYAVWNQSQSRIEMHLQSTTAQRVRLPGSSVTPAVTLEFAAGETIHTENSYKFTSSSIAALLEDSGFVPAQTFVDDAALFAVTLATVR